MSHPPINFRSLVVGLVFLVVFLSACRGPAQPLPTREAAPVSAPSATPLPARPTLAGEQPAAPTLPPLLPTPTVARPAIERAAPGAALVTYVAVEGIGKIAVLVTQPKTARYADGAGIIVLISTFVTGSKEFMTSPDFTTLGLIQVSYLWPGLDDRRGAQSEGMFDYGGADCLAALREVLRFAGGQIPDVDGYFIGERLSIAALTGQVGLYAFSHPGIAATNVLALYGEQLPNVRYFVGRENPTQDLLTAVELGHLDAQGKTFFNPLYRYPESYSAAGIQIDYSTIRWDAQARQPGGEYTGYPYFDLNGNERRDADDYMLGHRVPTMWGKRFYSTALLQALRDHGGLEAGNWPADLGTPEEAAEAWRLRSTPAWYAALKEKAPGLKVMLVFARQDHVQPAADKPHIHQAFDGFFHTAGLWVRLNPDQAYVALLAPAQATAYRDNPANAEPADWAQAEDWAYANQKQLTQLVPLAAAAEMADRVHEGRWEEDLDEALLGR